MNQVGCVCSATQRSAGKLSDVRQHFLSMPAAQQTVRFRHRRIEEVKSTTSGGHAPISRMRVETVKSFNT